MAQKEIHDVVGHSQNQLNTTDDQVYVLRLFVSGATPASTRAIANLKAVCDRRLKGRFQLEVIDIFQHPELAEADHIIATPTLVKQQPPPWRRFIGDLSDLEEKLFGLDVERPGV
jgi:circadian clock protein KaiB